MVDDAYPTVDLRITSTVADVFVDRGKAEADGCDQRGTVRVLQKPSAHVVERLPSVVQDWDSAMNEANRRSKKEAIAKRFSPIREDDELLNGWNSSPVPHDYDVPAVHDPKLPSSIAIAGTPPFTRLGSQELGDSPSPAARGSTPFPAFGPEIFSREESVDETHQAKEPNGALNGLAHGDDTSRKRKQTAEHDVPVKHPRTETNGSTAKSPTPASSTNSSRRRIPTFANPRRSMSIPAQSPPAPERGLGLGITKSPRRAKQSKPEFNSSQGVGKKPLFPSSSFNGSQRQKSADSPFLSSALKSAGAEKSHKRPSVSFADGDELEENDGNRNTERASKRKKPSEVTSSQTVPTSSQPVQMVYPEGYSLDKIRQIEEEAQKQEDEIRDAEEKLKNPDIDRDCATILHNILDIYAQIKHPRHRRHQDRRKSAQEWRNRLPALREQLRIAEAKTQPPTLDPPLPVTETTVAREIPTTLGHRESTTSDRSLSQGVTTRRRSATASSNARQSKSKSKSPVVPRKSPNSKLPSPSHQESPVTRSPAVAPVTHVEESESGDESWSESPSERGRQTSRATVEIKEEDSSDAEQQLNLQLFNQSAMDVDQERQEGQGKDRVSEDEQSSSGDSESSGDDSDDASDAGEGEKEDQNGEAQAESGSLHGPEMQLDAHASVSSESSDSRDPSDSEAQAQQTGKPEAEEQMLDGPTIQTNAQTARPTESSDSSDADDKEEDSEEQQGEHHGHQEPSLQVNGQIPKPNEPSLESSDSDADDDDSDEDPMIFRKAIEPKKTSENGKSPGSSAPPARSHPPSSSPAKMPVLQRTTLKGLLMQQQNSQQRAQQRTPPPARSQSKPGIYDVPSSEDSDSSAASEGDILPNGDHGKLRKPLRRS